MKKIGLILTVLVGLFFVLGHSVTADDGPDYSIPSYQAELHLYGDNTADFTQEVQYRFTSSYNGVYVSLGYAGNMPANFSIKDVQLESVQVAPEGQDYIDLGSTDYHYELKPVSFGKEIKLYHKGKKGDRLKVRIKWKLDQPLHVYRDVAVLNWKPITQWDETISDIQIRVTGLSGEGGSQLYMHRGFFKRQAEVVKEGNDYLISYHSLPSKETLELHGYWPISSLNQDQQLGGLGPKGLDEFNLAEKKIAEEQDKLSFYAYKLLPRLSAMILLLALIFALIFILQVYSNNRFSRNLRLYEAPLDMAPALLARYIYDKSLRDLSQAYPSQEKILQASLLDLIDRGYLKASLIEGTYYLQKTGKVEGLSDFEKEIISMAFSSMNEKKMEDLFDQYHISKKGKDKQSLVDAGQKMVERIEKSLDRIDADVDAQLEEKGLQELYRPLNGKEKFFYYGAKTFFCLAVLLPFVGTFYFLLKYDASAVSWLAVTLFVLAFGLAYLFGKGTRFYRDHGLIDKNKKEAYLQWQYFRNMIRQVGRLDQAELESVVLWNRILVYATLFGYAKRVRKALYVQEISLDNPSMELLATSPTYLIQSLAANQFSQAYQSASGFSNLNSSSGSSGGFSGGGGGGGGGAF